MAQTKANASKASRAKPKAKASTNARKSNSKARPKAKSAKSKSTKAKTTPKARTKAAKPAAGNGAVGASSNGHSPGKAIGKAKLPLLAGGAALLGAAGGMVYGATRSGAKVLGVRMPTSRRVSIRSSDLARAAKDVGHFGDRVGELAAEIRHVRHGVADDAKDSPVEVLLRGLTKRR